MTSSNPQHLEIKWELQHGNGGMSLTEPVGFFRSLFCGDCDVNKVGDPRFMENRRWVWKKLDNDAVVGKLDFEENGFWLASRTWLGL